MENEKNVAFDLQGAAEAECRYQVQIGFEKRKGEDGYRRWMQAETPTDAYRAMAILIMDMAQALGQPLDHAVAVLAAILLAPASDVQ